MRPTPRRFASVVAMATVGLIAIGCSNQTLNSGSENLGVKYVPSPSGAGRFNRAQFNIITLRVLPADPATAAIYGTTALSFRFDPFTADLTQVQAVTFAQIALAAGSYRVTRLDVTAPQLVDSDPIVNPATCLDAITAFPSGLASVPSTISYIDPTSLNFTVRPGQSKLSLTVNVPALISSFQNSFTCNPTLCGGSPCLTAFDTATFTSALLANLTLQ